MIRILVLFAIALAYSITRYVVFKPSNLEHLPVFVVNKAVSMGAALCFAMAFWRQWRRRRGHEGGDDPDVWFRAGVCGALMHIPMSLAILRPSYFKGFFDGDKLSFGGEAVFLFGACTAAGIYLVTRPHVSPTPRWWISLGTMTALFGHTLAMGLARGLNINASHGYLPPMWLISLIGIGAGLAFVLMSRPAGEARGAPSVGGG